MIVLVMFLAPEGSTKKPRDHEWQYARVVSPTGTRLKDVIRGRGARRLTREGLRLLGREPEPESANAYGQIVLSTTRNIREPHPVYPPVSAINGGPPFHPNCVHVLMPFVSGWRQPIATFSLGSYTTT